MAQASCSPLKLGLRSRKEDRGILCRAANKKSQRQKAKRPGLFEVQMKTPPKESLGIHAFHPNTANGDCIEVDGKDFIVDTLVYQYKLVRGKYEREHNRLDVLELSRYFYNMHLKSLLEKPQKDSS